MLSFDPVAIANTREPFDFHEFAPFNGASFAVFRGDGVEASDWELHRDTDEFLFVLQGTVTVEILTETDSYQCHLAAGQFVVVRRGLWHRHLNIQNLVELFFTPGASIQSDAKDPRIDA